MPISIKVWLSGIQRKALSWCKALTCGTVALRQSRQKDLKSCAKTCFWETSRPELQWKLFQNSLSLLFSTMLLHSYTVGYYILKKQNKTRPLLLFLLFFFFNLVGFRLQLSPNDALSDRLVTSYNLDTLLTVLIESLTAAKSRNGLLYFVTSCCNGQYTMHITLNIPCCAKIMIPMFYVDTRQCLYPVSKAPTN